MYPTSNPRVKNQLAQRYGRTARIGLQREGRRRCKNDVEKVVRVRCYTDKQQEVGMGRKDVQERHGDG